MKGRLALFNGTRGKNGEAIGGPVGAPVGHNRLDLNLFP